MFNLLKGILFGLVFTLGVIYAVNANANVLDEYFKTKRPGNADYYFVVPQRVGGGTDLWARIVAREISAKLNKKIIIMNLPGARDTMGFNKWDDDLRKDPRYVMVSHGGNAVSFLQDRVGYDYRDYSAVGLMSLNIILAKKKWSPLVKIKMAGTPGMIPEGMAIALIMCGNLPNVDAYIKCFRGKVHWLNGMNGGQRRAAFRRGEFNVTRENPVAYKKHVDTDPDAELWFHHSLVKINKDKTDLIIESDINWPITHTFLATYVEKNRIFPNNEFYNSYKLAKMFRDGLQKALWVDKGNPNLETLRNALRAVQNDPEAMGRIKKEIGDYDFTVGEEAELFRDLLMKKITKPALENLIRFTQFGLGLHGAIFKEDLLSK